MGGQSGPAGAPRLRAEMVNVALRRLLAALVLGGAAVAVSTPLPLGVSGARVVAVPPGIGETSVFGVLNNATAKPITLRGASSPVARSAMLMTTTRAGGMMGMAMAEALTVPPRGRLVLSETGAHVMLTGLRRPLKVGEAVPVTLRAADGRTLTIRATVRRPGT